MRARFKKLRKLLFITIILIFITTLVINLYIIFSTKNCIYNQVKDLPQRKFELVLGTEPIRPDGSINLHFLNRTDAAAKLYLIGKAKFILISGNKNNRGFNEVLEMKNRILTKGVPEMVLNLDYDGTRTWESIRRAKEIYHLQSIIIITDAFHAPRAIFLCKHFGIKAIAYCPRKASFGYWPVRYNLREYFARIKAFFDILTDRKHEFHE